MHDPYMKKLYCLLWCRIIHETIRPKLNYATIYDKCDCTCSFVCEFYNPRLFIYISKPFRFDINLSSKYQFSKSILWLKKTLSKGLLYFFFYFKIDNIFSFSKMVHIYKLQKKIKFIFIGGSPTSFGWTI